MLLTKQQILQARDRLHEDVPVPEWAPEGADPATASVRVRGMTGLERDAYEASMLPSGTGPDRKPNLRNMRARLCVLVMVDENGTRLWNDDEADMLGARSAVALDRIYGVAQRLSVSTTAGIREQAKNSDGAQPENSPSTSASP